MKRVVIALFVGGLLLFPYQFTAAAQPVPSALRSTVAQNFCSRFSTQAQKYEQNLAAQITKEQDRVAAENQKRQSNQHNFDTNLQQHRAQWANARQNLYSKLRAHASTTAEVQAVQTFQETVEADVTAREQAVDTAKTTFRQGIDQLIPHHQQAMETVLQTFQTAVQTAIAAATQGCTIGTDPTTVRQTFRSALAAARVSRQSGLQNVDKISTNVQQLVQTRNAAVQQAVETYRSQLHAAIAVLQAAFPAAHRGTTAATTTVSSTVQR